MLDLLAIWGERSVQISLQESHWNHDAYEEIAKVVVARDHQRTGEECRMKTKGMKQAYKRALAHNSKSGNSPTTAPFYDQLDSILKGDPTVKRHRLTQSLTREKATTSDNPPQMMTLELRSILDEEEGAPLHEEPCIIPSTSGES